LLLLVTQAAWGLQELMNAAKPQPEKPYSFQRVLPLAVLAQGLLGMLSLQWHVLARQQQRWLPLPLLQHYSSQPLHSLQHCLASCPGHYAAEPSSQLCTVPPG
jgi:hypothetical protein